MYPSPRLSRCTVLAALCASLTACVVVPSQNTTPPRPRVEAPPIRPIEYPPPPMAPLPERITSVYIDPPLQAPQVVILNWAPPPPLSEVPPPKPYYGATWIGGYWVWQSRWVWALGRWASPPSPRHNWVPPRYEAHQGRLRFQPGYWQGPAMPTVIPLAPPPPQPTLIEPPRPRPPGWEERREERRPDRRDERRDDEQPNPRDGRDRRDDRDGRTDLRPRPTTLPSPVMPTTSAPTQLTPSGNPATGSPRPQGREQPHPPKVSTEPTPQQRPASAPTPLTKPKGPKDGPADRQRSGKDRPSPATPASAASEPESSKR